MKLPGGINWKLKGLKMTIKTTKPTAILTVILLCFCTSELLAQYELILSSGITLPKEDNRTGWNWDTGYNFGAELIFPIDNSVLRFGIDLNYFRSPFSGHDNINNSVVTAMGNLTVVLPIHESVKVFVSGGLGMFRLHNEVPGVQFVGGNIVIDSDETTAGFKIGAGLDIPFNKRDSIVLKVHYLIGTLKESFNPLIPITIGWKIRL